MEQCGTHGVWTDWVSLYFITEVLVLHVKKTVCRFEMEHREFNHVYKLLPTLFPILLYGIQYTLRSLFTYNIVMNIA